MRAFQKSQPIGVYDSGVGGLTVLKTLHEKFPHENFVYFGDTLNLPYGTKSQEQIVHYSRNIITWLAQGPQVKLVVAACHTSSALALEEISKEFDVPIIGTIHPLVKSLLKKEAPQKIGILATPASVKSLTHEKIFVKAGFQGEIVSIACPDFVPLIEAEKWDRTALKKCAEVYLKIVEEKKLNALIYGCTHYPFIKSIVEEILPSSVTTIDPAKHIALEVFERLSKDNLLNGANVKGKSEFLCSSDPQAFGEKVQRLAGFESSNVILKDVHSSEMRSNSLL
ncbi:MAG: glutamate racemase [Alphaproteobacteria bacterium 16-39-46]|nr:MAG: glutamate racemase [Alphaproteobacteria bacterium 16-39-46]OZA42278.1 MAG: glutamate racemase [Alphaproteobacteria bacterium 17-39-52]HQS84053.1 glutamate racemase [Alphaproteobacteria bacterium]HQS93915.1 glutamate racemase [Alphaproteobacteria bacterium]